MTPEVLVSMSVIQLSLHLADRVAFATGFSIVYSIWKGPPSAGTSRLSLANTISGCAFGKVCFTLKEGAGWISAYETSMIASLFSAVSFLVTLKEMTPEVLVSMSVIQLSLHLADRVAFATGFSIVYSIWKGPPSAGTSRLSLANTISGCASGVTGSSLLHPAKSEEPKIPPPKIINNHTNLKYFIV